MGKKYTISHRLLSDLANYFDQAVHCERPRQIDDFHGFAKHNDLAGSHDNIPKQEILYRRGDCEVRLIISCCRESDALFRRSGTFISLGAWKVCNN